MSSGWVWVFLGFLIVATTKYLTSIRLRSLAEKMHREQQDANVLKSALVQAEEEESQLQTETDGLLSKLSALRNVLSNLEKQITRSAKSERVDADS